MATTDYVKMALAARRKVSRLTLKQQLEILQMYGEAIQYLAERAEEARQGSLTQSWAISFMRELTAERTRLQRGVQASLRGNIEQAAGYGAQPDRWFWGRVSKMAGIDLGPQFSTEPIIKPILTGKLYKDGRSLSNRIWDIGNVFERDVQYIINRGLIEKKSAVELAKDLEKYVQEPAKRPTDWGKAYPNLRSKQVDYNAQRLARTSLNHAYQTGTIKSSSLNPFIEGIEWQSALQHGRTCELCMDRHGKVYPVDDVPLDHPNGLCTLLPYIPKSLDQVAEELRHWVDGGYNPTLDRWYQQHGGYFAFKRL